MIKLMQALQFTPENALYFTAADDHCPSIEVRAPDMSEPVDDDYAWCTRWCAAPGCACKAKDTVGTNDICGCPSCFGWAVAERI